MSAPRCIGLVVHPRRDIDGALEVIRRWAQRSGTRMVQVDAAGSGPSIAEPGDPAECDLIIALGGDGTALAALRAAAAVGRPVLGVACGSLGVLTATTADALDSTLELVWRGEWRPRTLPGLAVVAGDRDGTVAINDMVVVRRGAGQIAIAVQVDGHLFVRFAGDGIVISTPAGSSAYTLAAGGPVLAPRSDAYVVTPLAPHGGCCPPLVCGSGSVVNLEVAPAHIGARVEVDGRITELEPVRLEVRWRADYATLVTLGDEEPFLDGLRRRRIIIDSPRILARDDRVPPDRLLPPD